jgi:hypothetical protein
MTMTEVDLYADVIDVRDIIEEYEEFAGSELKWHEIDHNRWGILGDILAALRGQGGDHDWDGSRFPVTLIRDSYFKTYAQEFAEDIGAISRDSAWPNDCIDWNMAARDLQMDYSSVEIDGIDYWYR